MKDKRLRFPNQDFMDVLKSLMPGTVNDFVKELGCSASNCMKYLNYMREERMIYVCGYVPRADCDTPTSTPPRIWDVGSLPDVKFTPLVRQKQTPTEFQERMARLQEARALARYHRSLRKESNAIFDAVDDESPHRVRAIAKLGDKLVTEALKKQNTLFKPLFDLAGMVQDE